MRRSRSLINCPSNPKSLIKQEYFGILAFRSGHSRLMFQSPYVYIYIGTLIYMEGSLCITLSPLKPYNKNKKKKDGDYRYLV
ncbi:hypothetical protein BJY00DRAFT_289565, partial [Aspergillus carlsbadensis]